MRVARLFCWLLLLAVALSQPSEAVRMGEMGSFLHPLEVHRTLAFGYEVRRICVG